MAKDLNLKLSVIILTKNEEEMISECIDSLVRLKDKEILVIDDGSIDDTISIAQFKKATVITHKKRSFAEARNFAATRAVGDWILYLDADERLSEDLVYEINELLNKDDLDIGYYITRVNYYFGKKWPKEEQLVRLIRKKFLIGWYGEVHESPKINGTINSLKHPLFHYTHRDISEMLENTIEWSEIEAKLRYQSNHPKVVWWRFFRVMLTTFSDYYFSQGGWKVGTVGLTESIYQTFSIFITYARLWEMQNTKKV